MNKYFFIAITIAFSVISCNTSSPKNEKLATAEKSDYFITKEIDSTGLILMKQKCYACHSVSSKNHDEIIAPPMIAVKRRYEKSHNSKDEFVNAIISWVSKPSEEDAIMYGAVKKFNVMPSLGYKKDEVKKIASYMFDNEIETPVWFQQHFKEMHTNGININ